MRTFLHPFRRVPSEGVYLSLDVIEIRFRYDVWINRTYHRAESPPRIY